jgi:hypothetical protein
MAQNRENRGLCGQMGQIPQKRLRSGSETAMMNDQRMNPHSRPWVTHTHAVHHPEARGWHTRRLAVRGLPRPR